MKVERMEIQKELMLNMRQSAVRLALYNYLPDSAVIDMMAQYIDCEHCPVFSIDQKCGDCKARLEEYLALKEIQYEESEVSE